MAAAAWATAAVPGAAQEQLWIGQWGTSSSDSAAALAADSAGGAFVAGTTRGSLGGPNAGDWDAWLARCDSDGNRHWIRQFGTSAQDQATALATDGAGGTFVAGWTAGSLGGPNAGLIDAWLARYDSAGNQLWIRQWGTSSIDVAAALAADSAGGAFVVGDDYLARYDSGGNQLWIQAGSYDGVLALAPDGAGGAFVAGSTWENLGGPNAGHTDAWLARHDSAGNQLWIRQFGTADYDCATALAPDAAGGFFATGWTSGNLGGNFAGISDPWLARYDSDGNRLWILQFGTAARDEAFGLAPDGAGGSFVTGFTWGALGGLSAGNTDVWLTRYDSAGNWLWSHQFGTESFDDGKALCPGPGGVFITGVTQGSLGGPSAGDWDAFLARYGADACYADCDASGTLDFFDFVCFQNLFVTGDLRADCDGSVALDILDFLCFQIEFGAGCP
jgi:hypothetical protein